jgi:hypothetical protein
MPVIKGMGPSWLRGGKTLITPAGGRPSEGDAEKSEKEEAGSDDEAKDEGEDKA